MIVKNKNSAFFMSQRSNVKAGELTALKHFGDSDHFVPFLRQGVENFRQLLMGEIVFSIGSQMHQNDSAVVSAFFVFAKKE